MFGLLFDNLSFCFRASLVQNKIDPSCTRFRIMALDVLTSDRNSSPSIPNCFYFGRSCPTFINVKNDTLQFLSLAESFMVESKIQNQGLTNVVQVK